MKFEVTILGNNSAFPAQGRYPSAQVVNHHEELFLVDCGEGTQIRMSQYSIKRSRIHHIFISHLHGDHVFGLPGLINSYHHHGRHVPLHIYGPVGIRAMIETVLRLSNSMIDFELVFYEIQSEKKLKIYENKDLRVYAFPIKHRVPTYGYMFQEKNTVINMSKEAIQKYHLTIDQIKTAKEGKPVTLASGELLSNDILTLPSPVSRSYAYCSDTVFDKAIVQWIKCVTVLYHEATFLHELEQKAVESMHSTALQAGMMAHMANVGQLLLGHFSSRYDDLSQFEQEAKEIFNAVQIAEEGHTYPIDVAHTLNP
ncbi:MAG TPA: ribonuclease Z [Saprospiraceae bacterium]|nr:ribonuclease Z [Saprospiraceae bacterium]